MNRGVRIPTHLLRWQRYLWVSCLVAITLLLTPQSVLAQNERPAVPNEALAAFTEGHRLPLLSEHDTGQGDSPVLHGPDTAGTVRAAARPPLPFRSPQIGPLVRAVSMNDIDRRTTAFFPQSLDQLTAVEMPDEEKWIRVDLSEQIVVAYENDVPIRAFLVSTGLPGTPTVTGEFRIRMKVNEQTMAGGEGSMYYNLPGVKWVQYFYEDYGFHGTYWHSNFGQPMSHGCVNMTDTDAKWLFDWAGPTWDGETDWYPSSVDNPGTMVIVTQ